MDSIVDLMTPYVEDHKRTLDLDNVQDFLDLMLIEQQKKKSGTKLIKSSKAEIYKILLILRLMFLESDFVS